MRTFDGRSLGLVAASAKVDHAPRIQRPASDVTTREVEALNRAQLLATGRQAQPFILEATISYLVTHGP